MVSTIGLTYLDVQLGENIIVTDFQVVYSDFPISHDGILGRSLLVSNRITIKASTMQRTR